jgi:laccase
MFVTIGLGLASCKPTETSCSSSAAQVPVATMNNQSFVLPTSMSMLDARYRNTPGGVYTRDFPDQPPVAFDYTNQTNRLLLGGVAAALLFPGEPSTKVRTLAYNATVEMVLQNTALVGRESHPMHLHGFNFFVLAQGFGNYDGGTAAAQFNLVNPQERNTIAVPTGGWAVIRFVADNPGK